jgi:glycogen debranching enzyme
MDRGAARLLADAEAVLRANDRGGYTVPAPALYPHQWNWDSAFIAIGWRHVDPRRAALELEMLLRGQWDDGMIPHIVFRAEGNYEPGPQTWKTIGAPGAPVRAQASSITQPPIAATAARNVLERSGGDSVVESSLRAVAAGLERWHAWFASTRDPTGIGAVAIVHPWESGMDNAPRWDAAMARVDPGNIEYRRADTTVIDPAQRPTRYDYDRYFYIANERARLGFAPPQPATEPLLIADVAMTSMLCRAEADLQWLQEALGIASSRAAARRARLMTALERSFWDADQGHYCDLDIRTGHVIDVDHIANYLPLYAGVVPPMRARDMVRQLQDPLRYGTAWPVPTVPPNDSSFEPRRYWRGPTWINVNWLLVVGMRTSGFEAEATHLAARTVELVDRSGFREYYDPLTGDGCGANDFAWTAALTIDFLVEHL